MNTHKDTEERSKKFMQIYLYTDKGNYFISTIYRRSSAMLNPDGWYYETFAWRLNDKDERTDWVEDNSGAISKKGAIKQHLEVIEKLNL